MALNFPVLNNPFRLNRTMARRSHSLCFFKQTTTHIFKGGFSQKALFYDFKHYSPTYPEQQTLLGR